LDYNRDNHKEITMSDKCKDRVGPEFKDRMEDIRKLWKLYTRGDEEGDPELGTFDEYGLALDYVAPGTFGDEQTRGYLRYQLSWGGPSDEFRFYMDENRDIEHIEYWFMDWFDGASVEPKGQDASLLREIFDDWKGLEIVDAEIKKAMVD